jgi:hypothetical protein
MKTSQYLIRYENLSWGREENKVSVALLCIGVCSRLVNSTSSFVFNINL